MLVALVILLDMECRLLSLVEVSAIETNVKEIPVLFLVAHLGLEITQSLIGHGDGDGGALLVYNPDWLWWWRGWCFVN